MTPHWYVIKTKPHKEEHVITLLTKAGFEVFFPKIKDTNFKGMSSRETIRPLFASYVFLETDFTDPATHQMVKYTRGVSKILCAENKPVPISEPIISFLKQRTNAQGIIEKAATTYKKGDRIRVKKGPLKELVGIIDKASSQDERISVLLNLVNYKMRATLHWGEIEKIRLD